jgi:Na+-translocating ferredoxin:NAD+ oxidoreductase RNF subunit RnfB
VDFNIPDQPVRYSSDTDGSTGEHWNSAFLYLCIDFKKARDSGDKYCARLIEFYVMVKLLRLIEVCLKKFYSEFCAGCYLCMHFMFRIV